MIVENSVQLEEFKRTYDREDCILIPIQLDDNKHSVSNELSLLYVQMWGGKEFILPFKLLPWCVTKSSEVTSPSIFESVINLSFSTIVPLILTSESNTDIFSHMAIILQL